MSKSKNQNGQSTIEFIFTFAFGISLIFLIFKSAMNYATGYMVHYATFMASRTYLTSESYFGNFGSPDISIQNSEGEAREVFKKYNLSIFGIDENNFKVNRPGLGTGEQLTVGVYTLFEQKMDIMGRLFGQNKLEMVSESFLGKEPTRALCAARVCKAMTGQEVCSNQMDITLFDDGC
ncbi:MAG: hypothetical protein AB7I27_07700 [Bacteriovoracaceae bacterium]